MYYENVYLLIYFRWNPLTNWFSEHYHVHLALTTDITLTPQPEQTISSIRSHLLKQHPWALPAYHHSTTSLKSLVIAMAMLDGGLSAEEAIACSSLESDYQIDRFVNNLVIHCTFMLSIDLNMLISLVKNTTFFCLT